MAAAAANAGSAHRKDGATRLAIALSGSLQSPAFSPDGKKILFTRFTRGYNRGSSDLFIYTLATGKLHKLVSNGSSNVNLPGSAWSKTGLITFSSDAGRHDEIYTIAASGKNPKPVRRTNRRALQSYEPSFSPNGNQLVFETHAIDNENGAITIFSLSDKTYTRLTGTGSYKQPNWSPAGNLILYQARTGSRWSIWTMTSKGRQRQRITPKSQSATDAVFTPDGKSIIYSAKAPGVHIANIFKIPLNGSHPIRITSYRGYDGAPSISPDKKQIIFESTHNYPENTHGTNLWVIKNP